MRANRLQNTWSIIKLQQNLDEITEEEILNAIDVPVPNRRGYLFWQNALFFMLILIICQGG